MKKNKLFLKFLNLTFLIVCLNVFNFFNTSLASSNFIEIKNLQEKFLSPTLGDFYLYLDATQLKFFDENSDPIKITVNGPDEFVETIDFNPSEKSFLLKKYKDVTPGSFSFNVDTSTIPILSDGKITVKYYPAEKSLNVGKEAITFAMIKFLHENPGPDPDPKPSKGSIKINLSNVDESDLFSSLDISGLLVNTKTSYSKEFTINLGKSISFVDLDSDISYIVQINGIGSPKDKIFYSPITFNTNPLEKGKNLEINLKYENKVADSNLDTVVFSASGLDSDLFDLQKISFYDKTSDIPGIYYDLISNKLINGNYYFVKANYYSQENLNRNIELNIKPPTDYKVSYLPKNIINDTSTESIIFSSTLPDPMKGTIILSLDSLADSEDNELFKDIDINGTLKNNSTGEMHDFKINLNKSLIFNQLTMGITYEIKINGIGSAKDGIYYAPISYTTGNIVESTGASVEYDPKLSEENLFQVNFLVFGDLPKETQKINFFDTNNNYQFLENDLVSGNYSFAKTIINTNYKIDSIVDYIIEMNPKSIGIETTDLKIKYIKNNIPVPGESSIKLNLKSLSLNENKLFGNLKIKGYLFNNSNNDVKNFEIGLGETQEFIELTSYSSYTIHLNGISSPLDGTTYDPINYTTFPLEKGANTINLNYLDYGKAIDLNSVNFTINTKGLKDLSVDFTDGNNDYQYIKNELLDSVYSFKKGETVEILPLVVAGYDFYKNPENVKDNVLNYSIEYKNISPIPGFGSLEITLNNVNTGLNLFKDLSINGNLKNLSSGKNLQISIKLGEVKVINSLDSGKYSLVLNGIGSPFDGLYYDPIGLSEIVVNNDEVKKVTIDYGKNNSNTSDVNFVVLGLKSDLLQSENISFTEKSNKYQLITSPLLSINYKFLKNLSFNYTINPLVDYDINFSPIDIDSTVKSVNVNFVPKIKPDPSKGINATYWCPWGGNTSYPSAVGGQFKTKYVSLDELSDFYNTIIITFITSKDDKITPVFEVGPLLINESDSNKEALISDIVYFFKDKFTKYGVIEENLNINKGLIVVNAEIQKIKDSVKSEIKNLIPKLKERNKKILISLGGERGTFIIKSTLNSLYPKNLNQKKDLNLLLINNNNSDSIIANIISIIDEYGFDGLDLDIETASMSSDPIIFGNLVKSIANNYRSKGKDFWITAAPEWTYLVESTAWYKSFFNSVDVNNMSYFFIQYYNQGPSHGVNCPEKNEYYHSISPTTNGPKVGTMDNFCVALTRVLTTDIIDANSQISNIDVFRIPKEKIVIGLPAANGASGSIAYVCSPDSLSNIIEILKAYNISPAGFMNWSADFDSLERIVSGDIVATHHAWDFANGVNKAMNGITPTPVIKDKGNIKITFGISSNTGLFDDLDSLKGFIKNNNDGSVSPITFKLNEPFILNNLLVENDYSIYVEGFGSALDSTYYFPVVNKKLPKILKDKTIETFIFYSKLSNEDMFSVNISSTGITDEILSGQKIYFIDSKTTQAYLKKENYNNILNSIDELNNVYLYKINNLINGSYKFPKNADDINVSLKPVGIILDSIEPKIIKSDTTAILLTFDGTTPIPPAPVSGKVNTTYYPLGWGSTPTVSDIPDAYNVICLAFALPDGKGGAKLSDLKYSESIEFKDDWSQSPAVKISNPLYLGNQLKNLQAKGKKILLSLGGETGIFSVKNDNDGNLLAKSLIELIKVWNLDGIDIDLEANSVKNSDGIAFGKCIKTVVDNFRNEGKEFWLTNAMEYPYLIPGTNGTNFYVDFLTYLGKDYFTYHWPQLYNQYDFKIKGNDGQLHWVGMPTCIAQDGMANFSTQAVWAFTTEAGAIANSNYKILPFPVNKFVIGLPSAPSGAGCSQSAIQFVPPSEVQTVWNNAVTVAGSSLGGFMSWDAGADYANNFAFGKAVDSVLGITKPASTCNILLNLASLTTNIFDDISIDGKIYNIDGTTVVENFKIKLGQSLTFSSLPSGVQYIVKINGLGSPKDNIYYSDINSTIRIIEQGETYTLNLTHELISLDKFDVNFTINGDLTSDLLSLQKVNFIDESGKIQFIENSLNNGIYKFLSNKTTDININPLSLYDLSYSPKKVISAQNLIATYTKKINPPIPTNNKVNTTFWSSWGGNGPTQYVPIDKVPDCYNVIIYSFIESSDTKTPVLNADKPELIPTIKILQNKGKKVLVSMGGQNANFNIKTIEDKDIFVSGMKAIISKYGFDGIDLDLESGAFSSDPIILGRAFSELLIWNSSLLLTAAPEFPVFTKGSFYDQLIQNIIVGDKIGIDNFYVIWPQIYNQGSIWDCYLNKTVDKNQGYLAYVKSVIINMIDLENKCGSYIKIPGNKIAIGIPAAKGGSGDGVYIKPEEFQTLWNDLISNGIECKGFMNWSADWDAYPQNVQLGIINSPNGSYIHNPWDTGNSVANVFKDKITIGEKIIYLDSINNIDIRENSNINILINNISDSEDFSTITEIIGYIFDKTDNKKHLITMNINENYSFTGIIGHEYDIYFQGLGNPLTGRYYNVLISKDNLLEVNDLNIVFSYEPIDISELNSVYLKIKELNNLCMLYNQKIHFYDFTENENNYFAFEKVDLRDGYYYFLKDKTTHIKIENESGDNFFYIDSDSFIKNDIQVIDVSFYGESLLTCA